MEKIKLDKTEAVVTFLKDTKEGKYAMLEPAIVEIPRTSTSRDDYLEEDEITILYSVTNQL
ncbi:MAG: hypothetical protein J6U54_02355 [Clostridiales bacterium]|nr:hypothetical protein [Clostridiales bacterium]